MTTPAAIAASPGLYDPTAPEPELRGNRCGQCSTVFFPPLRWGCEVCGAAAEQLGAQTLGTRGVLRSFAVVHSSLDPSVSTPYTVGEILLDAGPVIRGLMSTNDGHGIDQRVRAVWRIRARDEDTGADIIEPCFEAEEAT